MRLADDSVMTHEKRVPDGSIKAGKRGAVDSWDIFGTVVMAIAVLAALYAALYVRSGAAAIANGTLPSQAVVRPHTSYIPAEGD